MCKGETCGAGEVCMCMVYARSQRGRLGEEESSVETAVNM